MKAIKILLVLFSLYYAQSALAIDGNDWNKLPNDNQHAYTVGVIDAWQNIIGYCGAPQTACFPIKGMFESIVSCTSNRPYGQIAAIVAKYMKDHPEGWHYDMASIIFTALSQACKKTNP